MIKEEQILAERITPINSVYSQALSAIGGSQVSRISFIEWNFSQYAWNLENSW